MSVRGRAPIVVVRRPKKHRGHHGGAWKLAFADFMTALMALFLVLWILSSGSSSERAAVAEYFRTPLLVAMAGGDKNSASDSAIPGGGDDPTFADGTKLRLTPQQEQRVRSQEEEIRLRRLEAQIRETIAMDIQLRELQDQILIDITPEGLRIQLLDTEKRPMFEVGSAKVAPYMSTLLRTLAPLLNEQPNSIQISGHTDSRPYAGGEKGYSNWELSAERANASRRELVAGGRSSDKLLRTSGMSDRIPFNSADLYDASNRRIAVTVLDEAFANGILEQQEYLSEPPAASDPATDSEPATESSTSATESPANAPDAQL